MKNLFYTILLFLVSITSFSQHRETIQTDRPGQAIGSLTVGKGAFQIQSGIDNSFGSSTGFESQTFLFDNVFRYGLSNQFEISALIDYQSDQYKLTFMGLTSESSLSGISNFHLGFRYNVKEESEGIIPALGFQTRVKFPGVSEDYEMDHAGTEMVMVTGHSLPSNFSLTTNWIMATDGFWAAPDYRYIFNLGFSLTDKIGAFVETYGFLNGNQNIYFDTGIGYLANENLQFDISAGGGKNNDFSEFFISVGVSWRNNSATSE